MNPQKQQFIWLCDFPHGGQKLCMSRETTQFDASNTADLQGECGRSANVQRRWNFQEKRGWRAGELRARDLE